MTASGMADLISKNQPDFRPMIEKKQMAGDCSNLGAEKVLP
jgi:hypothetical protein